MSAPHRPFTYGTVNPRVPLSATTNTFDALLKGINGRKGINGNNKKEKELSSPVKPAQANTAAKKQSPKPAVKPAK